MMSVINRMDVFERLHALGLSPRHLADVVATPLTREALMQDYDTNFVSGGRVSAQNGGDIRLADVRIRPGGAKQTVGILDLGEQRGVYVEY